MLIYSRWKWEVDHLDCLSESVKCHSVYCNVSKPNRHTQRMNMGCELSERQDNVRIHVQLFRRYHLYRPFLIDIEMEVCAFMKGKREGQLFSRFLLPRVIKYSNFNHSCPYKGDLWIRNFRLDFEFANKMQAPEGQYRFDIRTYNGVTNETIFVVRAYFKILTKFGL